MGQLAEAHGPGHPCTAFECVQRAPQSRQRLLIVGIFAPGPDVFACLRKQFGGLVEKDRQYLRVYIIVHISQRIDQRGKCGDFVECIGGETLRGGVKCGCMRGDHIESI